MQAVAGAETIEGLKTKRMRGRISRIITEKVEKAEKTEKKFRISKKVLDKTKEK